MPLTFFGCCFTKVNDLSPLKGLPLTSLDWDVRLYNAADDTLVKSLPVTHFRGRPIADFWKEMGDRRKEAEEFVESLAKLPAKEQVEEVLEEVLKRWGDKPFKPTLETKQTGHVVTEVELKAFPATTPDLTPLMAFKALKKLTVSGATRQTDLSPVSSLELEELTCPDPVARKNAPVLAQIKTLKIINGQPAAAFWKLPPTRLQKPWSRLRNEWASRCLGRSCLRRWRCGNRFGVGRHPLRVGLCV